MDRARFEALLEAYGADPRRWPAAERAAAAAFKLQHGLELPAQLAEARQIDALLGAASAPAQSSDALLARVLAARPRPAAVDVRALAALAACALMGVLLGYGGGQLAPTTPAIDAAAAMTPDVAEDYYAMAFEAPFAAWEEEG